MICIIIISCVIKRILPNRGNAVRDDDTGQLCAIAKHILPNRSDRVWNRDAGQLCAIAKRIICNRFCPAFYDIRAGKDIGFCFY